MNKTLVVVLTMLVLVAALTLEPPAWSQVYPVRLDQEGVGPQSAGTTPPSLVLADGGIEFPDGSVQATAAASGSPAPVPRTGQSVVSAAGDDGSLQLGVIWPNPRFTINEVVAGVPDGTVTDNLTGLIWLRDANCFGSQTWADALTKTAALFDGCADCGGFNNDCALADGSIAGQWRVPNARELHSLMHYGVASPALPNTSGTGQWAEGDPFSDVQFDYWSSTTIAAQSTSAWGLSLGGDGFFGNFNKDNTSAVWPVRGGQ